MTELLQRMWAAIGETDPTAIGAVDEGGEPGLSSALPVDGLVRDSVAVASLAAARLTGTDSARVALDSARVRSTVATFVRVDGQTPDVWADLSGFWQCADGWVRTHANYPHHGARLRGALGLPDDAGKDAAAALLRRESAQDVEDRVVAAGGVAARVRTPEEWAAHPHALAVAQLPLVDSVPWGTAGHVRIEGREQGPAAPLAGIRVLDLTRVIAGPVATRTLALLGADVLRIDDPHLAEPLWQHLDTGAGKRSTLLDLRDPDARARIDELLDRADVLVTGYRPGALDALGLGDERVAERAPGIVIGRISAWGTSGPWAGRRGFDSIVQAASGIAMIESADGTRPGALPVQALDHSGGYLLAAGILSALGRRRETGQGARVRVALARVAHELLGLPRPDGRTSSAAPAGFPDEVTLPVVLGDASGSGAGRPVAHATIAQPAPAYSGGPATWRSPMHEWGSDLPHWSAS